MAQRGVRYRVPLGRQGQVSRGNRDLIVAGDLAIAENVVFEHDTLRLFPTLEVYDIGAFQTATQIRMDTPAQTTVVDLVTIIGDPAIPMVQIDPIAIQATASSPSLAWVLSLHAGLSVAVGEALILAISADTGLFPNAILGVADSQGNAWVRLTVDTGDTATNFTSIWMTVATTPLTQAGGDTVTVSFAASPNSALAWGQHWQGLTTAIDDFVSLPPTSIGLVDVDLPMWRQRAINRLWFAVAGWNSTTSDATWTQLVDQGNLTGASRRLSLATRILDGFVILAQTAWDADVLSSGAGATITKGSTTIGGGLGPFAPGSEITILGETHIIDDGNIPTTTTPWRQSSGGATWKVRDTTRLVTVIADHVGNTGSCFLGISDTISLGGGNTGFIHDTTPSTNLAVDMRHPRLIAAGKESAGAAKKLFLVNGIDPVHVMSGLTTPMTNIASPAADWDTVQNTQKQPINGVVHRNTLILFGNWNDPHRLYFSNPDDHEDFSTLAATSMRVASQIGRRLYGAAEYQGILYVWKYPRGIFYIDDTDVDFVNWAYHIRSDTLGCAPNPYAVLPIDDDVLFMAPDGHIHRLSAVNTLGGTSDSDLTLGLGLDAWTRDNLDLTRLDTISSCWDPKLRTAYFGVHSTAESAYRNDLLLIFDFALVDRGGPPRFSYANVWEPNSLCLFPRDVTGEPALMIGEGLTCFFVRPGEYGARVDRAPGTGESDPIAFGYPHLVQLQSGDFGDQNDDAKPRWKHYRSLVLAWVTPPEAAVTVRCYVDDELRQTFTLPANVDYTSLSLNVGRGHAFAVAVEGDGVTPLALARYLSMTVYYELGGEQALVA